MGLKVLVADPVSEEALEPLKSYAQVDIKTGLKLEALMAVIGDYDAMIVRSQTQVTADVIKAGKKLQVIARAGVGVDNVDVEEATKQGIMVVNAPTGNTISAAEHTVALMFALARHIPQANASLRSGQWQRNKFVGIEVRNKTLGIIGLGNVGSEVARRARGLDMKLIGFDPFISVEHARTLQVELVPLEKLFKESDFITIHLPLTETTRNIIGAKELATMKPTVRIINAARGELIDEQALAKAVKEKRVAGAAIDVFPQEPVTECVLFHDENIIVTPHLGASTAEAQVIVARDVVAQIIDIFNGRPARYAVNAPFISTETLAALMPFIKVCSALAKLARQLSEGQTSAVRIKYQGEMAECDTTALKAAVIGGLLEGVSEERVNLVNAGVVAAKRGLMMSEEKGTDCGNYASLITVEVTTNKGVTTVSGTLLNGETHIVRVNDFSLDVVPTGGYFLFSDHQDRPGLIGAVGQITGEADINISFMHLGRLKPRGPALMVLALDEPLPEEQRQKILALKDVHNARLVNL